MTTRAAPSHWILRHEQTIADAMRGVASEIRLVDLNHLTMLIHNGRMANIDDLVNSSTELHFRPGTLDFTGAAQTELSWISHLP